MYRITEAGLAEARRWFDQGPAEPPVLKHSLALRLFFGHLTGPKRLAELLTEYADSLVRTIAELTALREELRDSEQFRFPALVAEWGLDYYQSEISATRRITERLAQHGGEG